MTIGFNQSLYIIPEARDFVDVCVNLVGDLEREIIAEVLFVEALASGNGNFKLYIERISCFLYENSW